MLCPLRVARKRKQLNRINRISMEKKSKLDHNEIGLEFVMISEGKSLFLYFFKAIFNTDIGQL